MAGYRLMMFARALDDERYFVPRFAPGREA
jgi:hypothetical protein